MLENASVDDIAAAVRKWTTGEDGQPVRVSVLRHPNADDARVTASGTGTSVAEALNMFSKEFAMPYTATHDGRVLLGSGYMFRKQQVGADDTLASIAERFETEASLMRDINAPDPKRGSYVIVPVPVNP